MKNIICFSSQKQSGKDAAASHFIKIKGGDWTRQAFADGIKDSFCELFGVTKEFIEEWKENPEIPPGFNITCREALQFVGDGFRGIKSDVWIEYALRTAKDHDLVIPDGRYLNELARVKECGGTIILIYRPGHLNNIKHLSEAEIRPIIKWFVDNDIPEGKFDHKLYNCNVQGVEFIDFYLINDGTLEDWQNKIEEYLI